MSQLFRFLNSLPTNIRYKFLQLRIHTTKSPYHIQFRKSPYSIIFVLSHMRSGSSLLSHILNSNPEIIGYGETHQRYESVQDFKSLIFRIYWLNREMDMNHTYLFDKILHNHKIVNNSILTSENLHSIFLLREPKRTLSSILDIKPHLTEEQATNYYINRLLDLEVYARLINSKDRCLLIKYDQLIKKSDLVFQKLQRFLKTQKGFSEKYDLMRTTGMRGIGDSSDNIHAGQIIRQERKLSRKISPELTQKADKAFDDCQLVLTQYCQSIES